ncbi:hypothetical protein [Polaribacter aestuariivivens]|uniref:hypothetical protein n=1 Tax=Polaribacter aestuariivivens TaxID=2304626 RepID=UPI003F49AAC0
MNKSSIHFKNIKNTSQSHNLRLRDFDYVRKNLTPLNKSYGELLPHKDIIAELKNLIKEKTGRSAQKRTKILIEGVFLFKKEHTNQELFKVAKEFGRKFKINILELHIHRDEGHYHKETGVWTPNFHAHIVSENVDRKTGKTVKWNREDLSLIQDFFAEELKMQRGEKSGKKHLNSLEYKIKKEYENLKKVMTKSENTELLLLQSQMFGDYINEELNFQAKVKYLEYSKNHPSRKKFDEKMAELRRREKENRIKKRNNRGLKKL